MTNKELVDILKTVDGVSLYTVRAELGAKLPYAVLSFGSTSNFIADDKVTERIQSDTLELYTLRKDEAVEAAVEAVLDAHGIPWQSDEAVDDAEQFYIKYYYFIWRN